MIHLFATDRQTDRHTRTPKQTPASCYHTVSTVTHSTHVSKLRCLLWFGSLLIPSFISVLRSSFSYVLVSFFVFLFLFSFSASLYLSASLYIFLSLFLIPFKLPVPHHFLVSFSSYYLCR
jgi:hypothetical protein